MGKHFTTAKKSFVSGVILFTLAALAYLNTLGNGFVWDDHIFIENNRFIGDPSNIAKILSREYFASVQPVRGAARPLVLASFMADRRMWGAGPEGYHFTNVLIHACSAAAFFYLTLSFASFELAALSAAIFAVHPIHTEAVNQISFRGDLLAVFFSLLSLAAYLRVFSSRRPAGKAAYLSAAGAAFGLALLSKEMAITLPASAMAADLLFFGGRRESGSNARIRLGAVIVFSAVGLWYLAFRMPRFQYQNIPPQIGSSGAPAEGVPKDGADIMLASAPQWREIYERPGLNFRTMSGVIAEYFRLMVFPFPLHVDRAPRLIHAFKSPRLWTSWTLLALLLWAAGWCLIKGRHPVIAFGLVWCFISLLPVSNLIPIYNPMAERYLYYVSVGACWALASVLIEIADSFQRTEQFRVRAAASVLLLASYFVLTVRRNADWKSDWTLFQSEAARGSGSARVHFNLGFLRQREGDIDGARAEYQTALILHPSYAEALNNLGVIDREAGGTDAPRAAK